MSAVAACNNTYDQIEITVRRLTASPNPSTLTTATIQQYINQFSSADFPNAIKVDQMRDVYTFYTVPYQDRYPIDVNYIQGIRAPVYIDGIQGALFKDRAQFFAVWPKFPTTFQRVSGNGVTQLFSFNIGPTSLIPLTVFIGFQDISGAFISIADDGNGNLQLKSPNPQVSVPVQTTNAAVPGMYNRNTANPGLINPTKVGNVNYFTGQFTLNFAPVALTPDTGSVLRTRVSQYQPGRPQSVLFFNNELTIRPIPKEIHQITVETYLTPVQFMLTTDSPILNQWVQYISLGASLKILRDRQDLDGVANLMPFFKEQEGLVLERQANEEIGQRNSTIFSGSTPSAQGSQGFGLGGWY